LRSFDPTPRPAPKALFTLLLALGALFVGSRATAEPRGLHSETTVVPFVGGDSDVGLGGGFIASWARVSPEYLPFLVRLEAGTNLTGRKGVDGFEMPYLDSYLLVDLPHVLRKRLHLRFRASHTRELTLKYYGLGNASRIEAGRPREYFLYERSHPTLDFRAEYQLTHALQLLWRASYTQNWFEIPPEGQLARDMREGPEKVQRLLGSAESHAVATFSYGLGWDDRDDQVSPHRGQYHQLRVDLAPGGSEGFPYRWGRANAAFRIYLPVIPRRLTLALRVVSDFLFGHVPFYELPRYDSTSAIGGVHGVRGVPAQRYYGKLKAFGNLELRSELFDFRLLGKKNRFGVTAFVDAGRLWADYHANPELDGDGLGLKYGIGGGPRIAAGKSFVLRLDVAWSKEARPLAAYLTSGQMF
jgi:outer membrane protein assembly factor BamA